MEFLPGVPLGHFFSVPGVEGREFVVGEDVDESLPHGHQDDHQQREHEGRLLERLHDPRHTDTEDLPAGPRNKQKNDDTYSVTKQKDTYTKIVLLNRISKIGNLLIR